MNQYLDILLYLQGIPESMAISFATAVFLEEIISVKKILILGIISSLCIYLLRLLPLSFGFHTIFMLLIYSLLLSYFYQKNIINTVLAAIKSIILLAVFEVISTHIFIALSGFTLEEIMNNKVLKTIVMLPQAILLFITSLIILYFRKYKRREVKEYV